MLNYRECKVYLFTPPNRFNEVEVIEDGRDGRCLERLVHFARFHHREVIARVLTFDNDQGLALLDGIPHFLTHDGNQFLGQFGIARHGDLNLRHTANDRVFHFIGVRDLAKAWQASPRGVFTVEQVCQVVVLQSKAMGGAQSGGARILRASSRILREVFLFKTEDRGTCRRMRQAAPWKGAPPQENACIPLKNR